MKKLIFLGTGHAHVTKCYNTCFALVEEGGVFLTDAGGGNGILTQLERAGIAIADIRFMFVSHIHTDHILGAVWVIRLFLAGCRRNSRRETLTIYGNSEVIRTLRTLCDMLIQPQYAALMGEHVRFTEVHDEEKVFIFENELRFFDLKARTAPQYGYVLTYGSGKKLVFTGDERFRADEALLRDADWAIMEATTPFGADPQLSAHATIRSSAECAEAAGVKRLVITHTEDQALDERKERYVREARRYFGGDVYVPDDLDELELQHLFR